MKKIREAWYMKVIAWIMITVSACTFMGSCVGAVEMEVVGVFDHTFEKKQLELQKDICEEYAVRAVYTMLYEPEGTNQTYFADKGFRYGIIETDDLDQVDLNKASSYLERNFTEEIDRMNCNTLDISVNDHTEFWYDEGILGGEEHYYFDADGSLQRLYADRICYDTTGGIFYYRADGKYYPVTQLAMDYAGLEFSYEFDRKNRVYRNQEVYDAIAYEFEQEQTDEDEVTNNEEVLFDYKVVNILNQTQITFNQLDRTSFDYSHWGSFVFDSVRELDARELSFIDSRDIKESDFPKVLESYLDNNYTLNVLNEAGETKTYWVISYVDDSVLHNGYEKSGLFTIFTDILREDENKLPIMNALLIQAYRYRVAIFIIMLMSFMIMLGSFVFLMCAAGHRKDTEGITQTILDRIPFDVFTGIFLVIEIIAFVIVGSVFASASIQMAFGMFVVVGLCIGWILLLYLLSLSVRFKCHSVLKNTICYKVLHKLYELLNGLFINISIVWKAIIVMAIVTFVEIVLLAFAENYSEMFLGVLVLLLIKAILYGFILHRLIMFNRLFIGSKKLAEGDLAYHIETEKMPDVFRQYGDNLNSIGIGMAKAVDERMRSERMKTELITNVSHDIKTPLTSIINYVDLLQKEELQNAKAEEYLEVLERQSSKLKKLIEDLVEASKASSGCLPVHMESIDIGVLLMQAAGEFEDKLKASGLELIMTKPDTSVMTMADGRHLWRVIDNIMNNICKYSQPGSRVYMNLEQDEIEVRMIFRNVSRYQLNISSDELMERFVRGDKSRNTEGHGLGLSIARSLMELMNGKLDVVIDGDLFKVIVELPSQTKHSL